MDKLRVRFLLFDGFSNMVLACLLEPLRAARDHLGGSVEWVVGTADDLPVASSSGLRIAPQIEDRAPSRSDLLVVVSGYGFRAHASRATSRKLRALASRADQVVGADTAAWLLAEAGLLDGCAATVHWQVLAEFGETFLRVAATPGGYVRAGRFWTCADASSALRMILSFIGEKFGPDVAFDVSAMFIGEAQEGGPRDGSMAGLTGSGSQKLQQVLAAMVRTIETPLSLAVLAREAKLSLRGLNRLFLQELGVAPGRYYQSLRLARARDLCANTALSQQEIALRCGFSGAPALSRAFSARYGFAIGAARQGRSRSVSRSGSVPG